MWDMEQFCQTAGHTKTHQTYKLNKYLTAVIIILPVKKNSQI